VAELNLPWQKVRDSVEVKLYQPESELYVRQSHRRRSSRVGNALRATDADRALATGHRPPATIPGGRGSHTPFNPAPPEAQLTSAFLRHSNFSARARAPFIRGAPEALREFRTGQSDATGCLECKPAEFAIGTKMAIDRRPSNRTPPDAFSRQSFP